MTKSKKITLLKQIVPKNEKQKEFFNSVKDFDFIVSDSPFGCGKSYLCVGLACQMLSQEAIDRIIITRPATSIISQMGFPSGNYVEKGLSFFKQQIRYFQEFLGESVFNQLIKNGTIEMPPIEIIRGSDWKRALMVFDEAQTGNQQDFEMFLSRMSIKSKAIIVGDSEQNNHGNCYFARWFENIEHENLCKIRFAEEDILRHGDAYNLVKQTRDIM